MMRRREFLELSAAGAVSAALSGFARADGGDIRGRVTSGGKALEGVTVSDGLRCVRTDAGGRYSLPRREGARFVTVSPPCGYRISATFSPGL